MKEISNAMPGKPAGYTASGQTPTMNLEERIRRWLEDRLEALDLVERDLQKHVRTVIGIFRLSRQDLVQDIKDEPQYPVEARKFTDGQPSLDELRKSVLVFELMQLTCLGKEEADRIADDLFVAYNTIATESKKLENGNCVQSRPLSQPATRSEPVSRSELEINYASAFPALPPKDIKPKVQSQSFVNFWQRSPLRSSRPVQSSQNKVFGQNGSNGKAQPVMFKKSRSNGKENDYLPPCSELKKKVVRNRESRSRRDSSSSASPKSVEESRYLAMARSVLLHCLGLDDSPDRGGSVKGMGSEERKRRTTTESDPKNQWLILDPFLKPEQSCWDPAHVTNCPWWEALQDTNNESTDRSQRSASEPHLSKQEPVAASRSSDITTQAYKESPDCLPPLFPASPLPSFADTPILDESESSKENLGGFFSHDVSKGFQSSSSNLNSFALDSQRTIEPPFSITDQISQDHFEISNHAHSTSTICSSNPCSCPLDFGLGLSIWNKNYISTAQWPGLESDIPSCSSLLPVASLLHHVHKPPGREFSCLPNSRHSCDAAGAVHGSTVCLEESTDSCKENVTVSEYLSKTADISHQIQHQILSENQNGQTVSGRTLNSIDFMNPQFHEINTLSNLCHEDKKLFSHLSGPELDHPLHSTTDLLGQQPRHSWMPSCNMDSGNHFVQWEATCASESDWKTHQYISDSLPFLTDSAQSEPPASLLPESLIISHHTYPEFHQPFPFSPPGATVPIPHNFTDTSPPSTSDRHCGQASLDLACGCHCKENQQDLNHFPMFDHEAYKYQPHFSFSSTFESKSKCLNNNFIPQSVFLEARTFEDHISHSASFHQAQPFHHDLFCRSEDATYNHFKGENVVFPSLPDSYSIGTSDAQRKEQSDGDLLGLRKLVFCVEKSPWDDLTESYTEHVPLLSDSDSGCSVSNLVPDFVFKSCDDIPLGKASQVFCSCKGACNCFSGLSLKFYLPEGQNAFNICEPPTCLGSSPSSLQASRYVAKSASDSDLYCVPSEKSAFKKVSSRSYPSLIGSNRPQKLVHSFHVSSRPQLYKPCLIEHASEQQLKKVQENTLEIIRTEDSELGSGNVSMPDTSILSHPDVFGEWSSQLDTVPDFLVKTSKETQTLECEDKCVALETPFSAPQPVRETYEEKSWKDLCPLTEEDIQRDFLHAMSQAHQQGIFLDVGALEEYNQLVDFPSMEVSSASGLLPQSQAVYVKDLESAWLGQCRRRSWKNREKLRRPLHPNKPCSFYLEGCCFRSDCKFSHDISTITCHFWQEGQCFKGELCPFLHGYFGGPLVGDVSEEFDMTKEDFPELTRKEVRLNSAPASKKKKTHKKNSVHRTQLPRGT